MPEQDIHAPTIMVLLGATGDLAERKIIPALFRLFAEGKLPHKIAFTGFSRRNLTSGKFGEYVGASLAKHKKEGSSGKEPAAFRSLFSYVQGEFQVQEDYQKLAEHLEAIDDEWGVCTNKLFYLAVPPQFYQTIFEHLHGTKLSAPCGVPNWTRVIVEKPFGKNLATAQDIDIVLGKVFREEQIYRVDHYLGKEMVQNILAFRFSNNLFESTWNKDAIERIDIRLMEKIDIEGRGAFYDGIGALRDVGQNHLLQMLALIAMEHPSTFDPRAIRDRRLEALKNLRLLGGKDAAQTTARAQYEGYTKENEVAPHSRTETYFKIQAEIDTPRWKTVPIILEAGKALALDRKEIVITFRHPSLCLCPQEEHYKNQISIRVGGEESITIRFLAKKPGRGMEVEPRDFEFYLHKDEPAAHHVEEYERLLLDAIVGDQTLFVSTGEVKTMWRFIDPIVRAWQKEEVPLQIYKKGITK